MARFSALDGDLDGDGLADIVIGTALDATEGPGGEGRVLIFYDALSGVALAEEADAALWANAEAQTDGGSTVVAGGRDLNQDGFDDLVIGLPSYYPSTATEDYFFWDSPGAAYLVLGGGISSL